MQIPSAHQNIYGSSFSIPFPKEFSQLLFKNLSIFFLKKLSGVWMQWMLKQMLKTDSWTLIGHTCGIFNHNLIFLPFRKLWNVLSWGEKQPRKIYTVLSWFCQKMVKKIEGEWKDSAVNYQLSFWLLQTIMRVRFRVSECCVTSDFFCLLVV